MRLRATALGVTLAALGSACIVAPCGAAEPSGSPRVALLDDDDALLRALTLALGTWRVEVRKVEAPAPGASMPSALSSARRLAREMQTESVIWLSLADDGFTLWVYDTHTDRVSARALERPPPFDDATAAALALSIKAILRTTEVAPVEERFGAPPSSALPPTWKADIALGAALRPGASQVAEPRVSMGGSVWPAFVGRRLGVRLALDAGAGIRTTQPAFSGTLSDTSVEMTLVGRVPLGGSFVFEPALGGSVHRLSLSGYAVDGGPGGVERFVPAFEARGTVDAGFFQGHVRVGPTLGLVCMPRSYEFEVRGAPVLTLSPVRVDASLRLSVAFE